MRCAILLTLLMLNGCAPKQVATSRFATTIEVAATSIPLNPREPTQSVVGKLRYLGGLHLESTDPRFGGLSGLRWDAGHLFAITDQGDFLVFPTIETGDRLTGIGPVRLRRLTNRSNRPLRGKTDGDAEALELLIDDDDCAGFGKCEAVAAVVGFEGQARRWRWRLNNRLPTGAAQVEDGGAKWLGGQPNNGGLEAMSGQDQLWALVSEEQRDGGGAISAWLLHNGWHSDAPWSIEQPIGVPLADDGFNPTDAESFKPFNGDARHLLLLRRYNPADGVAARIVGYALGNEDQDRRLEISGTTVLATLAPPLNVDNMEGLAVRLEEGKGTYLYLISDDNFSQVQRTLLLKFELLD